MELKFIIVVTANALLLISHECLLSTEDVNYLFSLDDSPIDVNTCFLTLVMAVRPVAYSTILSLT